MEKNPAPADPDHMALEMDGVDDIKHPPQSGEQFSEVSSHFYDGCYPLYAMYNEKTAEFDRELVNNWLEHSRDLMVLSGLVSAAIAAFLAQFYIASLQTSQDVSAFWLAQIYQLQTNLTNSSGPSQKDIPTSNPAPHAGQIYVVWFCGLGMSLSSSALATLLQSWIRRYIVMTQPQQSPRGRALIRAFVRLEGSLNSLQLTVDFLHLLLDGSIFTFLAGLIVLVPLSRSQYGSFTTLIIILSPLAFLYAIFTLISFIRPTIYSTPASRMMRNIRQLAKLILPFKNSYFKSSPDPRSNTFLRFDWATLEFADRVAAKLIETQPLLLEKKIAGWLLQSLHHDQDFERFLECLPGFYRSGLVKEPKEIFRNHHKDQVPRAILAFLDRTLSSVTLPDDIKQRRIKLSLQVMELDSYLLERTFSQILSLPAEPTVFRCIDFVLVVDRFSCESNADLEVQLLATCIIAVAISNITPEKLMDERWLRIIERRSPLPISTFNTNSEGQLDSTKLDNLVSLVGVLRSADPQYRDTIPPATLSMACNFPVENVASESRSNFCDLWNQLLDSTTEDPMIQSLILSNVRTVYVALHTGTDDPPFASADYPQCTNPNHRLTGDLTPIANSQGRLALGSH